MVDTQRGLVKSTQLKKQRKKSILKRLKDKMLGSVKMPRKALTILMLTGMLVFANIVSLKAYTWKLSDTEEEIMEKANKERKQEEEQKKQEEDQRKVNELRKQRMKNINKFNREYELDKRNYGDLGVISKKRISKNTGKEIIDVTGITYGWAYANEWEKTQGNKLLKTKLFRGEGKIVKISKIIPDEDGNQREKFTGYDYCYSISPDDPLRKDPEIKKYMINRTRIEMILRYDIWIPEDVDYTEWIKTHPKDKSFEYEQVDGEPYVESMSLLPMILQIGETAKKYGGVGPTGVALTEIINSNENSNGLWDWIDEEEMQYREQGRDDLADNLVWFGSWTGYLYEMHRFYDKHPDLDNELEKRYAVIEKEVDEGTRKIDPLYTVTKDAKKRYMYLKLYLNIAEKIYEKNRYKNNTGEVVTTR